MAFSQSDLTAIRAAIASGVMVTRFADGREVRYQSLDSMLAAEKRIAAAVADTATTTARSDRRRFASFSNGA